MSRGNVPGGMLTRVALLIGVLVLGSCGGGDNKGAGEASLGGTDPCSLLTKGEVLAHVNLPPSVQPEDIVSTDFTPFPPVFPEPVGIRYCTFFKQEPFVEVNVGVSSGLAEEVFARWKREAGERHDLQPVKGIGDEGVWFVQRDSPTTPSSGLLLRKGDKVLAMKVDVPDDTRRVRATRLARLAVRRL